MPGPVPLPSSPLLRKDDAHIKNAVHDEARTRRKTSHTTPSSSNDRSGSGTQTSVVSSAHSSAQASEEEHTIITLPAQLPDEASTSVNNSVTTSTSPSGSGGRHMKGNDSIAVKIVSPEHHSTQPTTTQATTTHTESSVSTSSGAMSGEKRESLLTMSAAAKVSESATSWANTTPAPSSPAGLQTSQADSNSAAAADTGLAASESKDQFDLMSSSVGGHHLSLTEGCVFMKQSCSTREERFYELIRPHQEKLVALAVRDAVRTIRRCRQKARGAAAISATDAHDVDMNSVHPNYDSNCYSVNESSTSEGNAAEPDAKDGLSVHTPPTLPERHETALQSSTSHSPDEANALTGGKEDAKREDTVDAEQRRLAAALWWTVMVEESEWSHVASFEVQRVDNHSFANSSLSSLGRAGQTNKGTAPVVVAEQVITTATTTTTSAGVDGDHHINSNGAVADSVQGDMSVEAAALTRMTSYEQEKMRALNCLAPFLPRFHGVRRFQASELASLCGSCHRGWYTPNPCKHSPSDSPRSDPTPLDASAAAATTTTTAEKPLLLLPRPSASQTMDSLHNNIALSSHTLPPLPPQTSLYGSATAATSCHAMREQFDALSPRSATSLATSPRSLQEEQAASPLSPYSPLHAARVITGRAERSVSQGEQPISAAGTSLPGQSAFTSHSSPLEDAKTSVTKSNDISNKSRVYQMIAMEDVCYGFVHPCVLDIKMGSRQYGLHPSPAKKRSKEEKALRTTSAKYGIRLAGFKRWDNMRGRYVMKTKLQCRPLSLVEVKAELSSFLLNSRPMELMFRKQIENLRVAFSTQKIFRFYTSSLLFVYDAAAPLLTGRIVMVDFAYTYEVAELVQDNDPEAEFDYDVGYIKALDTLLSLLA